MINIKHRLSLVKDPLTRADIADLEVNIKDFNKAVKIIKLFTYFHWKFPSMSKLVTKPEDRGSPGGLTPLLCIGTFDHIIEEKISQSLKNSINLVTLAKLSVK